MSTPFKEGDLILFTGDRNADSLGTGYAGMICGRLGVLHPELNLRFRNTGISGHRTRDLLARWEEDCLALRPDWLSILVGVNNAWRRYDSNDPTPVEVFESEYRELLEQVRDKTDATSVLCSPFLLPINDFVTGMREDLDPKIAVIRKLADEFDAVWVDFDAAFTAAQQRHIPSYWAEDGVHPSNAGHALMAETWLGVIGN
jgi:lysophospholipase L1-like esterase